MNHAATKADARGSIGSDSGNNSNKIRTSSSISTNNKINPIRTNTTVGGHRPSNGNEGTPQRTRPTTKLLVLLVLFQISMFFMSSILYWGPDSIPPEDPIAEMEAGMPIEVHEVSAMNTMEPAPATAAPTHPRATSAPASTMPRLIVHVGPSKTASTTLQRRMRFLLTFHDLARDNYTYVGKGHAGESYQGLEMRNTYNLFSESCISRSATVLQEEENRILSTNSSNTDVSAFLYSPALPRCMKNTRMVLRALKNDGLSLILSDERWSHKMLLEAGGVFTHPLYFQVFKHVLQDWNVSFVVTYRRTFEWMLSSMKQYNAMKTQMGDAPCRQWPSDGGEPYEDTWKMIQEWVESNTTVPNGQHEKVTIAGIFIFMDGAIQMWRNAGFPVHVMNLYSQRDLSEQLLCDAIPDAPKACKTKQNKERDRHQNVRDMEWYTFNGIVFEAANRSIISAEMQANKIRSGVATDLAKYFGETLNKTRVHLPLKCPTKTELQDFLDMSLAIEKKWMPELYASPDGEAAHRASFQRIAYEKREFCSVDMDRLFDEVKSWDELLEKLKQEWD